MSPQAWARRREWLLVVVIVAVALAARLYRVDNPLLDWHAWRQADTASVTREYLKHGLQPLQPTYLDLSSTPSGTDNPAGYRMVEFPLINLISASLLMIAPWIGQELFGRLFSIAFSLIGLVSLYGLVKTISGVKVALAAALVYAVLPFSMYYGRVVLPEPVVVCTVLVSLYSFQRWLQMQRWRWYLLAFAALSIAYLLKPYAIFFAPVFAALAYLRFGWAMLLNPSLWVLALVPPVPLLGWRWWITRYPEGIPGSDWLFNGNEIRFKPSWVRWIFFERLHRLINGTLGTILLAGNVLHITTKELLVYGAWWFGMLAYVTILATGNVQHDYYQALLIPIVAITLGRGMVVLVHSLQAKTESPGKIVMLTLLLAGVALYGATFITGTQLSGYFPDKLEKEWQTFVLTSALTIGMLSFSAKIKRAWASLNIWLFVLAIFFGAWQFSWQYVDGYFNVNHWEFVRAGQAVQAVAAPDALVIAPHMGDTQLLFQTDRRGWPIGGNIDHKITQGADYYLSTNRDDETNDLLKRFAVIKSTDEFILIDLNAPLIATSSGVSL